MLASADACHPIKHGVCQSFSVFIDTIGIGGCTAFVILLGDVYVYVPGAEGIDGVALTQQSLVFHLGDWSRCFLTGAILLLAFSSINYNYYSGEIARPVMTYQPASLHIFWFSLMGIVFLGATAPAATSVFFISDRMMGILAIVKLLALMMLLPIAKRLIVDFSTQLKTAVQGVAPLFKGPNLL